ncbi:major facilitator superfamily domain-containing protein [Cladochytrium replicatum]|nr:major facilitator superfamily domain-containing protein [Cladochytrium replicatum]
MLLCSRPERLGCQILLRLKHRDPTIDPIHATVKLCVLENAQLILAEQTINPTNMASFTERAKQAVVVHFSSTKYNRTEAQLEREKWLIPGVIPFTRWVLMPAAVLIQLCVGSLYAFSALTDPFSFQGDYYLPIETAILGPNGGIDRSQASITFYLAVAVFGSTAAILGPWMERNGPFRGTLLGAILFYAGNLLAALGVYVKQFWVVWLGYGVVGGMGLGIGYISPVSPLQKWFPEMRGIAAGLAVCGFGGGSIIAPYTQLALIGNKYSKNPDEGNLGVPLTFVILGTCYFVVMVICGLALRMPPPGYEVKGININTIKGAENTANNANLAPVAGSSNSSGAAVVQVHNEDDEKDKEEKEKLNTSNEVTVAIEEQPVVDTASLFSMTLLESLGSTEFRLMYAMLFCAQITGLLVISKIQSICANQLKQSADMAATYNSALGVMNLLGRLILPTLSDFIGRKPIFILSLVVQAICLGMMPVTIHTRSLPGFLTVAFIIAMVYGAGFGIIPAFLADQFSSKNIGATHGVILTAWSLAGVAGGLTFNAILAQETNAARAFAGQNSALLDDALLRIYDINLIWVLVLVCVGFVITSLIPVNLRERRLPRKEGEIFRFTVRRRITRVFKSSANVKPTLNILGFKVVRYTEEEENVEWEEYVALRIASSGKQAANGDESTALVK